MAIDPRGADLKRFLQDGEPGEVVMINLLRFVEGGREHYEEYARAIGPFLAKVGGTIISAAGALIAQACRTESASAPRHRRRLRGRHAQAVRLQIARQRIANVAMVVDDQNMGTRFGHCHS